MPAFRYTNPLIRDPALAMRDSFILKDGGRWYLTGTLLPAWTGPNPGVRLLVSDDLLSWRHETWLIDAAALPDDCAYNGRFWAPEIHRAHGRHWLTVNSGRAGPVHGERRMDGHHIHLFVAERITGPYRFVAGPLGEGFKNDASLFTDEDGRSYIYASGGGLWQAEIDLQGLRRDGACPVSTGPAGTRSVPLPTWTELAWQRVAGPRDPGTPDWMRGGIEGPFVIRRHGCYWMFFSAWTRGYEVGVLRAATPLGPWTLHPREPIFGTRKRQYRQQQMEDGGYAHLVFDDTLDPFAEVGHGAVFEGPDGGDWLCCHYLPEQAKAFTDGVPQVGVEPMDFVDGTWRVPGPTWTEQVVPLREEAFT